MCGKRGIARRCLKRHPAKPRRVNFNPCVCAVIRNINYVANAAIELARGYIIALGVSGGNSQRAEQQCRRSGKVNAIAIFIFIEKIINEIRTGRWCPR